MNFLNRFNELKTPFLSEQIVHNFQNGAIIANIKVDKKNTENSG